MISTFELALNFGILIFIILFYLLIPKLTMETIHFGVRIPPSRTGDPRLRQISKTYSLRVLAYSIPVVVLAVIFYRDYTLDVIVIMFEFIASIVAYLQAHYRLLNIEDEEDWYSEVTQVSYAALSNGGAPIDLLFLFAPMVIIAALTTVIGIEVYPTLPAVIATQFYSNGTASSYMTKSYASVLLLPIMQFVMAAVFITIAYFIIKSKINVEVHAPKNSYRAQTLFRTRTIVLLAFIGIILGIILLISSLAEWGLINEKLILPFTILLIVMELGIVLEFSIKYGQMGSRVLRSMQVEPATPDTQEANIDDNKEWKAGILYDNKNDKAIFVPKRFGIGYTINWANPKAILVLVLIILAVTIPEIVIFLVLS